MTTTQAIEKNPAAYSTQQRQTAIDTLWGMGRHLMGLANANGGNIGMQSAAIAKMVRATRLEMWCQENSK